MRNSLALLLFASAAALDLGCARTAPAPPPETEVLVTPVIQRDVPIVSEWIGTLDGSVNAAIRPKVEGYLRRQLYKEGQYVNAGDLLFEVDPRQFRAALEQADGALGQGEPSASRSWTMPSPPSGMPRRPSLRPARSWTRRP
jgi:multidrug efflux pump subunit AcrA (membrane-fusion protein)